MAVVNELSGVEAWLYATLNADATMQALIGNPVRVYAGVAPEGAAFPYVVMSFLSGPDTIATGGARVMSRPLYLVMAVDQSSSFANCRDVMKQVDTLINNAKDGTTSDTRILSCIREQPYERVDADASGLVYRYLGGRYRLEVQPL